MESSSKNNFFKENSAKIAEKLGPGKRMSVGQKQEYIETHGHKFFHNVDLVNSQTYAELFSSLDLRNKTIINVGAGYALSDSYRGLNPMIDGLTQTEPEILYVPLDYNQDRSQSWALLENEEPILNDRVILEPVTADATALPFANESIDGYLSANLINEPREKQSELKFVSEVIAEAYRVIKPGGFILLSSFGYFWWKTENGQVQYNDSIDIEEIVEKEQVLEILKRIGFSNIKELPLDTSEAELALKQRLERHPKAIEAGIRDACAFYATK